MVGCISRQRRIDIGRGKLRRTNILAAGVNKAAKTAERNAEHCINRHRLAIKNIVLTGHIIVTGVAQGFCRHSA
jgi:GH25 family lysozyme M1 (1,4-beta-N-acetylmuramidase)